MSEETRHSSQLHFLNRLLDRGRLNSGVFFSGTACGLNEHGDGSPQGYLHLVQRQPIRVESGNMPPVEVNQPSLVLFAQPQKHRIYASETDGADLVCARLSFDGLIAHPRLLGLPEVLIIPFSDNPDMESISMRLFSEAFNDGFGRDQAVNLLVELLLLYILRHCLDQGLVAPGMLSGLSDGRIAKVLIAIQQDPAGDWNLESLAAVAGMSRASFAAHFKAGLGVSPGSYLTTERLTLAKHGLLAGKALKTVANEVGYKSTTALSRCFQRHFGHGPRALLKDR